MACASHHINSLSIDSDGWIVAPGHHAEDAPPIIVTRSCERLLKGTKLDLSAILLKEGRGGESVDRAALENLEHNPGLPGHIEKVMADIRRLGGPSETDLKKRAKERGGGDGRNKRGRRNKAAQLEEQRRLRQQKQNSQEELEGNEDELRSDDDGENDDDEDGSPDEEEDIPVELRLAATFNTLRVLITLFRPIVDHPLQKDWALKMKNGPSIKKDGRHRFYLFSDQVYACVSTGGWNEKARKYKELLNELGIGLFESMSKRNSDGVYEENPRDWIASLFDHELFASEERLADKCMAVEDANPDAAAKLHDALMNRFETEHDKKQYMLTRAIDALQDKLMSAISRRFKGARLTVYGSCLSGLALEGSHDVDCSVFIPELDRLKRDFDGDLISGEEYEKKMRRIIYKVRDCLEYDRSRSFADLFAITRARVPVIKGTDVQARNPYTQDGHLSFDLCFLNDIAVANSSLLREYSLFDGRVRIMMLAVKSFAKANGIASAADGTLSSYSWLNMVVFYLQSIGLLPALQCPQMMEEHDFAPDTTNHWHSVNGLETHFLSKEMVTKRRIWEPSPHVADANTATLLLGFFRFYANVFPTQTVAGSIRYGTCSLQKTAFHQTSKSWRICIEDPFETFNSHCPHDLGIHVKEDGQRKINDHLLGAAMAMEALMQDEMASEEVVSEFLCKLLGQKGKEEVQARNAPQQNRGGRGGQSKNSGNADKRGGARPQMKGGGRGRGGRGRGDGGRGGRGGGGRGGRGGGGKDRPDNTQQKNGRQKNNASTSMQDAQTSQQRMQISLADEDREQRERIIQRKLAKRARFKQKQKERKAAAKKDKDNAAQQLAAKPLSGEKAEQ
ncbi:hypothetical protein ACHAXT_002396 [Thalassiosira profunda]